MAQKRMNYARRALAVLLALLVLISASVAYSADLPPETPAHSEAIISEEIPTTQAETPPAELPAGETPNEQASPADAGHEEALEEIKDALQEELDRPASQEEPEEPTEEFQPMAAGYTVLEDGISAVVTDFAQLKEAIEKDNGIVNVHLGADITLETNRTEIPASKAEFKLSGIDPRTGAQYTITEVNSTALANIVVPNINGNATRRVTMEDLTIINRGDYYGLIGVEDGNKGVELVARNVTFNGRQFAYNVYGHLVFEGNNTVNILTVNGGGAQELAEALNVTVRGTLNVDFQSTYPVFKMDLGAGNMVVEGTLNVNAPQVASANGVIRSAGSSNAVTVDIRPGAAMHVVSSARLVGEAANSLHVGAGAAFHYEWTGGLYAGIRLRKELTVGEDAVFYYRHSASDGYMFRFDGGPAGYSGGLMEFENPKQVTLINDANGAMVYGAANGRFQVSTQYLDYWQRSQSLDGPPTYNFDLAGTPDGESILVGLTHTAGSPTSLETNHSGITKDVLKLDASAKQLVFGRWTQAVLRFEGRYEQSGDVMTEFSMEDQAAEMGAEINIKLQEIAGYIVTGYAIDSGNIYPLQGNEIAIVPEKRELLVTIYYSEPIIEIMVPVKMAFAAYESDGGDISSAQYSFENKSPFAVDVYLNHVEEQGAPEIKNDLWLYLEPENKDQYNRVNIVSADGNGSYIGALAGRGGSMRFTLDGAYYGAFGKDPLRPAYNLAFTFGINGKGENI
ncbi:MAG: pectate lyase-like adhesive domain-containing protein [Christensenellaceae bacterium]